MEELETLDTNHVISVTSFDRKMTRDRFPGNRRIQFRENKVCGKHIEGRRQIQRTRNLRVARGCSRRNKPVEPIVLRRLSPLEILETVEMAA